MHCAIIYDFDGTLAEGDCDQHGLMPSFGIENDQQRGTFWSEVKKTTQKENADEIAVYLWELIKKAKINGLVANLSKENLKKYGENIPLFPGVKEWFSKINRYAADNGIGLSHYIVSSGLEEMIRGTVIAEYFKEIFACRYVYDANNEPIWPAIVINYTTKTQFLFRINKGIENCWDNNSVNRYTEPSQRPIPFTHMIYIGDGDTDIPAMKMVKYQGGHSIAVFDEKKWENVKTQEKVQKLIAEERSDYVVPANYNENSQLMVSVKGILQLIRRKYS